MRWIVVDQTGRTRGYGSEYSANVDHDVRSLGCVAIGLSADSLILKAVPHQTTGRTFVAASRIIQDQRPARIALLWYASKWHEELYSSCKAARERLMSLMLNSSDTQRFHMRGRPITSLPNNHQLVPLIELWRANAGSIDLLASQEAILNHTKSKYLAVKSDRSDGTLKFTNFGPGSYAIYGDKNWMMKCLGQRVQDQPDSEYGYWIAQSYRQAMQSDMPVLNDVDTIVSDPVDGARRRVTYVRLTLPVNGADGERLLLSTSCQDPLVDLRPPIH